MQTKFRQRFCSALAVLLGLNILVTWQPGQNLLPQATAATATTKTIIFARSSSSLTVSAKQTLVSWRKSLISAKAITVTGYAPKSGNPLNQKRLAIARANAVGAKIGSVGATATVTLKTALLRTSGSNTQAADKAVITITKLKIVATASPSASPTISASPSASSTPTPTPTAPSSGGKFIMNFVDCNFAHKQVVGTTLFYRPLSGPQLNQASISLPESATSNEPNNLMNCAITWQDVKLSPGEYQVAIEAKCIDILDSEVSGSAACTPNKYSYFDSVTKTRVPLTGSGPEATEAGYRMVIELPGTFTESSSLVFESDIE